MRPKPQTKQTLLALFVEKRLGELELTSFCRQTGFDQGALSKIQSGLATTPSLESALRLAVGLNVPPAQILGLIGRNDLYELVTTAYLNQQRFAALLLAAALDHHDRFYINGSHNEANWALCHEVVNVSIETRILISQMKAEIARKGEHPMEGHLILTQDVM